ncbi:MAG: NAD(P)-dependent oxidoreductase [Planctomycetes bacterium]|nr:NAD(P)-dependent oxidoreductase [Planctomycetota bacterium]
MKSSMRIKQVTIFGASGKLGQALTQRFLDQGMSVRAVVHRTPLPIKHRKLSTVRADVTDRKKVKKAVAGSKSVICLATTKEDPETFFDVSIRGTFNILDECRACTSIKQVILAGGDAAVGIWFYPHPKPIGESHPLMAYPGYYAFSKVMEEVMANQYHIQYDLPTTILRMSWIFTDKDILNHLSLRNLNPAEKGHGWDDYLTAAHKKILARGENRIPILIDRNRRPYTRHIVHIDDVVQGFELALGNKKAIGQTYNISGKKAFRYDEAAAYLSKKTGIPTTQVQAKEYYSFEIDIRKAKRELGYKPKYDIFKIIDAALSEN